MLNLTYTWEKRKLENLIIKGGSGGTPKSTIAEYYEGNIPFLGITDISNSNGFIDDTNKHISERGLNNSAAWVVPKGAISLAMYASVGKLAILNTDLATSQAFYNMVFDNNDLRDYVYQRLKKSFDFGEWERLISTGTQSNLNSKKVKSFEIRVPINNNEIVKVSSFFKKLDNLITVNQRKGEKLQELKKALLQKMFVSENNDIPKVRFSGHTDIWEKRQRDS
ncbi:restriction endonuclease subunit S [Weissella kandleri]|uniref:restriction endonuclease subunit S n=1 Tax=Weissella kandleri TaxID=1616 RepID=UPI00387E37BF